MKNTAKRRLWAWLLAGAITLTQLPLSAMASEDTETAYSAQTLEAESQTGETASAESGSGASDAAQVSETLPSDQEYTADDASANTSTDEQVNQSESGSDASADNADYAQADTGASDASNAQTDSETNESGYYESDESESESGESESNESESIETESESETDAASLSVIYTAIDQDGKTIDGYAEQTLTVTGDIALNDVDGAPVAIEGYKYVEAKIADAVIEKIGLQQETQSFYYVTGGESVSITEGLQVTFVYEQEYTKQEYTFEDDMISVKATLADPQAVPDDAIFTVKKIDADTTGYNYEAYMEALNRLAESAEEDADTESVVYVGEDGNAEGDAYTEENTLLYDMAFMAAEKDADGNLTGNLYEYEPTAGSVAIQITFKQNQLSEDINVTDAGDVEVIHLPLTQEVKDTVSSTEEATNITVDDILVETVAADLSVDAEETADFELDSFSVIALADSKTENGNYYSADAINYKTILGDGVEYGVIADEYRQGNHAETNFAVKKYTNGNNDDFDLSNPVKIPFIVGEINTRLWLSGNADHNTINITLPEGEENKISTDGLTTGENEEVYINYTYKSQSEIADIVQSMQNEILANSNTLAGAELTTGYKIEGKTIDTTDLPDNITIVINAREIQKQINNTNFWVNRPVIKKKKGQNIVINVDATDAESDRYYDLTEVREYDVEVIGDEEDAGGFFQPDKQTYNGNDSSINQNLDKYILQHIIWNITSPKVTSIHDTAGLFLVNNGQEVVDVKNAAGWVVSQNTVYSSSEWHFIYHKRTGEDYDLAGNTSVTAHKTLKGGTLADKQFDFSMTELTASDNGWTIREGGGSETVSNNANGDIIFNNFYYTKEDLGEDGTAQRRYVMQEVIPTGADKEDDITYDTTLYMVVIDLSKPTEEGSTTITTETHVYPCKYDANTGISGISGIYTQDGDEITDFSKVTFTNSTGDAATGSATVKANKTLAEKAPGDSKFSFTLKELTKADDASGWSISQNPEKRIPSSENDADGNISFEIKYYESDLGGKTTAQKYYLLQEEIRDDTATGKIVYDDTLYMVVVDLTAPSEGDTKITTVTTIYPCTKDNSSYIQGTGTVDKVIFKNDIRESGEVAEGEVTINGVKKMSGGKFVKGDTWTFTISGVSSDPADTTVPMPGSTTATIEIDDETEVKDEAAYEAAFTFGKIEYDADSIGKTYTYTIKETKGTADGIIYDTNEKNVKVTVNGKKTDAPTELDITVEGNTESNLTFTNTVTAVKVSKVDAETGNALTGAKIQLLDSKNNVVAEWTSSSNAVTLQRLKVGEVYTLKEVSAPEGYELAEPTTVVLKEGGTLDSSTTTPVEKENGVLLIKDVKVQEQTESESQKQTESEKQTETETETESEYEDESESETKATEKSTEKKTIAAVDTGDNSPILPLAAAGLGSLILACWILIRKRRAI